MRNYLIILRVNVPYPVEHTEKVKCLSFGTAIQRALKSEGFKKLIHRRHFKALTIRAERLRDIKVD